MNRPRILIAGIGNIFLGDDAFGVEVVQRLARRPLPEEVRVVDFGIRGLDLTYALLDGYETVILVDAAPRGGPPGTLYVLEPDARRRRAGRGGAADRDARHGPGEGAAAGRGDGRAGRPSAGGGLRAGAGRATWKTCKTGLSEPVRAAVDEAVRLIESLVAQLLGGDGEAVAGAVPGR